MRFVLAVLAMFVLVVLLALTPRWALGAGETTPVERKVGKAVYGYGQIRYGGRGPEAWRWRLVLEKRRAERLQRLLAARVLEVRSLRREVTLLERLNLDPILAIRVVFGPWADEAIRVASCETGRTFHTGAANGQYRGLFQMGSSERATYGHGETALAQARAAYRYFVASGRDWSPWECRP